MPSTENANPGNPRPSVAVRVWRGFLVFLEMIGLREPPVDRESQLLRFKLNHTAFRNLLSSNNNFLETIADLENKLNTGFHVGRDYIRLRAHRAVTDIHIMTRSINEIAPGRYEALYNVLDEISGRIHELLEAVEDIAPSPLVMDMADANIAHFDSIGGKMANLSELRNTLGMPVPDGFIITTAACGLILEQTGIKTVIRSGALQDLVNQHSASELSAELAMRILNTELPPELIDEIYAAYERLCVRLGRTPHLAVRSSAIGEDSGLSYAGQFMTVLNVDRRGIAAAYLSVLASLFSPEAIQYRLMHGITGTVTAMAVGCIAMVDASVSGIMYSNNPGDPEPGHVIIHAVRGLGALLADGCESPEETLVSRDAEPRIISRTASGQTVELKCGEGPGTARRPVDETQRLAPILNDEKSLDLARAALALEAHFGKAQDIEWAIDLEGRPVMLQSRPLRMSTGAKRSGKPIEGAIVLLDGGDTACTGVGTGPATFFDEESDPDQFPDGGILVARGSSPKFVHVMARAKAIVTDIGSTTGHMASLAREFRIPALLNTKKATHILRSGEMITVDAANGYVYAGEVAIPATLSAAAPETAATAAPHRTPGLMLLESVAGHIIPLCLTNPRSAQFRIENCRTLHDLARFIHEKSYEEMFHIGETMGDMRAAGYMLDVFLPIDLYIIDIGGGLDPPQKGRRIRPERITSAPLSALVRGMLHPEIQRYGAKPISAGGFFSLMMRHAMNNPESEKTFSGPSYAIASETYLNYTARVGYHFSVVDAYCGSTVNKNYINVMFRGGAADRVRRTRRVQIIAQILKEYGFSTSVRRDSVNARLSKVPDDEINSSLDILGRLFQFMRQMDVSMSDDASAASIRDAFLKGDYGMQNIQRNGKTERID